MLKKKKNAVTKSKPREPSVVDVLSIPRKFRLSQKEWETVFGERAQAFSLAHLKRWQLQNAKARFSHVIDEMQAHGPQIVTRHGKDVAAIIPIEDLYKILPRGAGDINQKGGLLAMFRRAPKVDLKITRSKELPRPGPLFD